MFNLYLKTCKILICFLITPDNIVTVLKRNRGCLSYSEDTNPQEHVYASILRKAADILVLPDIASILYHTLNKKMKN